MRWHAHEMIFGYLAAIIAGFALTTVPNWTGRLPLSGLLLARLVALWLAGRFASAFSGSLTWAAAIDLAFLMVLAAAIWREILAGKNSRNASDCVANYHLRLGQSPIPTGDGNACPPRLWPTPCAWSDDLAHRAARSSDYAELHS
jgi:uncharacterized protein involved in response to NO